MSKQKKTNKAPFKATRFRKTKILCLVLLGVFLIIFVLEITNTTHWFHKQKAISGTIPSSGIPSHTTSSSVNTQAKTNSVQPKVDTTAPSSSKVTTPTSSSGNLVSPYGSFVSNHGPTLSNSPSAPSSEQSVCITSPGASCTITFTMDGVIKTLDAKTADSQGAAYWNWDIISAGFTEGSWTINATATSDGQSKTVKDPLVLQVGP